MITIIFGSNGVGKSSLMTHFLNESAFDARRIFQGQKEVFCLNQDLGLNIPWYYKKNIPSAPPIFSPLAIISA